jgi:hypothetical protein
MNQERALQQSCKRGRCLRSDPLPLLVSYIFSLLPQQQSEARSSDPSFACWDTSLLCQCASLCVHACSSHGCVPVHFSHNCITEHQVYERWQDFLEPEMGVHVHRASMLASQEALPGLPPCLVHSECNLFDRIAACALCGRRCLFSVMARLSIHFIM